MGTANTYSISSPWRTPVQDGHGLVRDRCSKLYIKTGGEPLLARLNSWAYCTTGHLKAKSPPTTDDGNVMYVVIGNNCFYRMACYPGIYTASTEQRYNSKYHRVNTTTLYNSKNIPRRQQSQATTQNTSRSVNPASDSGRDRTRTPRISSDIQYSFLPCTCETVFVAL